jgi:hypothetical protein
MVGVIEIFNNFIAVKPNIRANTPFIIAASMVKYDSMILLRL